MLRHPFITKYKEKRPEPAIMEEIIKVVRGWYVYELLFIRKLINIDLIDKKKYSVIQNSQAQRGRFNRLYMRLKTETL